MRAVVLGGGIAGLLAAATIAPHVIELAILEKDRIPAGWSPRRGVPQSSQLHNLLGAAQQHLDAVVPGFCDTLIASGADHASVAAQTHVVEFGQVMPRRDLGLRLISAPRPRIEGLLRDCVLARPNVTLHQEVVATGIEVNDAGVASVTMADHSQMTAGLVVDALGTKSLMPAWLASAGQPAPRTESLRAAQWYVSVIVRRPARLVGDPTFMLIFPGAEGTRGGLLSPRGPREWSLSLSGEDPDAPPLDAVAIAAYAETLEDCGIATSLMGSRLWSRPRLFRKPYSAWRRYDELTGIPPGLLSLGDSVASLNPLLGQGISVAAWQAHLLKDLLADAGVHDRGALSTGFAASAATAVRAALSLTCLTAQPLADSRGKPVNAAGHFERLASCMAGEPLLHRAYARMWHLLEPSATLTSPAVVDWALASPRRTWNDGKVGLT